VQTETSALVSQLPCHLSKFNVAPP